MKWEIGVCRVGYGHHEYIVEADNEDQAHEIAMKEAGDHLYNETHSKYELDYIFPKPEKGPENQDGN